MPQAPITGQTEMTRLQDIHGIGPALRSGLEKLGITDVPALAAADVATLTQVRGISLARAQTFIATAQTIVQAIGNTAAPAAPEPKPSESKAASKKGGKAEKPRGKKAKKAKAKDNKKKTAETKGKKAKSGKKKNGKDSAKKKSR